jgi:hypothetical protein
VEPPAAGRARGGSSSAGLLYCAVMNCRAIALVGTSAAAAFLRIANTGLGLSIVRAVVNAHR